MTYIETKGTAKDSKDSRLAAGCLIGNESLTTAATKCPAVDLQTRSRPGDSEKVSRQPGYFSDVLAEIKQLASRAELIRAANDRCQGKDKFNRDCDWLAYTHQRQTQLSLRPKRTWPEGEVAEGFKVLCPACTTAYDKKYATKQRKAS